MKLKKISLSLLFAAIVIVAAGSIFSQNNNYQDDPNIDRIPYHLLRQSWTSPALRSPVAVVTAPDGYDNFYLGVDFAEPHISVNPLNPLQYFAAYNTNATYYTMNGLDWGRNNPNFGFTMMGDPVTAYDSLGNLYYSNMYGDGTSVYGTKIAVSSNNGQTWSIVGGNSGNDKNWIAADQTGGPYANYVYETITSGTTGRVIRSTNRGLSFDFVATLTPHNLPGMMPAVGPRVGPGVDVPGGVVYVVTNSGNSFTPAYNFFRSTDGGTSFQLSSTQYYAGYVGTNVSGRSSVQNMRTRPYPFIAADNSYGPNRGRLYLVYATNNPPGDGNKSDIYCRYSTDMGATFSSPVTINDDANSTANYQWFPSIWCDKKTGRLFVKWLDTRSTPTSDSAEVWASYSDNGGVSFSSNVKLSTTKFRINCTSCGGGGTPMYLGDYDAMASNGKYSMAVWTDFRQNSFGSYTAYYPDYAVKLNPLRINLGNNDSALVRVIIPSVKSYTDGVKITAAIDTLPTSGSMQISFVNNKDSISSYPDSVTVRVKTIGTVNPRVYNLIVTTKGPNGIPVHSRVQALYVNVATASIGTNREGQCDFKINGTQYNTRQTFIGTIGSTVNVQAISPKIVGGTRFVYKNWSDNGDTTHNFTLTAPVTLTANYKAQYRLILNSSVGNSFGGGNFYDSAVAFQFGVNSKLFNYNGTLYRFRGWDGVGNGAYTSADSTGNDTVVTVSIINVISETARWTPYVGISNISTEIPSVFRLYQNYPNPFNPVTNINFDVAHSGKVRITVYDVLGKEIDVLANDILQPGSYRATFDASKFSSGIYFYRLEAPGFSDIKRMIVLK